MIGPHADPGRAMARWSWGVAALAAGRHEEAYGQRPAASTFRKDDATIRTCGIGFWSTSSRRRSTAGQEGDANHSCGTRSGSSLAQDGRCSSQTCITRTPCWPPTATRRRFEPKRNSRRGRLRVRACSSRTASGSGGSGDPPILGLRCARRVMRSTRSAPGHGANERARSYALRGRPVAGGPTTWSMRCPHRSCRSPSWHRRA